MEIKFSANICNNFIKKNMKNMILSNLSKFNSMQNYVSPYLLFMNKSQNNNNKIDTNLNKNLNLNLYMNIIPSLFFSQIKEYFMKNITAKLEKENSLIITTSEQKENHKENCIMKITTFKRKKMKLKKQKNVKKYKKIKNSLKKKMK